MVKVSDSTYVGSGGGGATAGGLVHQCAPGNNPGGSGGAGTTTSITGSPTSKTQAEVEVDLVHGLQHLLLPLELVAPVELVA